MIPHVRRTPHSLCTQPEPPFRPARGHPQRVAGTNRSASSIIDIIDREGFEALVDIASGRVSAGDLPRKVAAIVQEWCLVHQQELQNNWVRAQQFEPLERIQGADRD